MASALGGRAGVVNFAARYWFRMRTDDTIANMVCAALESARPTRGRARQFWRVFARSLMPMVIVDNERRYLAVNPATRLLARLSMGEFRGRQIDDFTPPRMQWTMRDRWAEFIRTGSLAGTLEVEYPEGAEFRVVYCGVTNMLPGGHLIVFAPADWPADELGELDHEEREPLPGPLSPREREVLSLIATGADFRQIAGELTIAPTTARTHAQNALRKLGARNRPHAIALAMRQGLIYGSQR